MCSSYNAPKHTQVLLFFYIKKSSNKLKHRQPRSNTTLRKTFIMAHLICLLVAILFDTCRAQGQTFPCSSSCILQDDNGYPLYDFSPFWDTVLSSDDSSDSSYELQLSGNPIAPNVCQGDQTPGSAVQLYPNSCYFLGVGCNALCVHYMFFFNTFFR